MPKVALDEIEDLINDDEDQEASVEFRRKLRKEKKELNQKKIKFYSREYMHE